MPGGPLWGLTPGAKYKGTQQSGGTSYDVEVTLQSLDTANGAMAGYLTIEGLTSEYPKLTTYFDADIVGLGGNSFLTRNWDADESVDRSHWSRFSEWSKWATNFNTSFEHPVDPLGSDSVLFMRWKERFLVPDHRVTSIGGASFAGFYYMVYSKDSSSFRGFYYHVEGEKYQAVTLNPVSEKSSFGEFTFR